MFSNSIQNFKVKFKYLIGVLMWGFLLQNDNAGPPPQRFGMGPQMSMSASGASWRPIFPPPHWGAPPAPPNLLAAPPPPPPPS